MKPIAMLAAALLLAFAAPGARAGIDVEVGNGDKITGTISPATEVETFRVRVPAGATISVAAKAAKKGPELHVVLLDPMGGNPRTADGRSARISRATAAASGTYAVQVSSRNGVAAGDYSLSVTWKSPATFTKTTVLASLQLDTLDFAADAGAVATITAKPARKSAAQAVLNQLTAPDAGVTALSAASARPALALGGDYVLAYGNLGPAAGGVTATVKIKPPKAARRKIALTSKVIGSGSANGDTAVAAIVGAGGGTVTVPVLAPGDPGAALSGSAVTVPPGALGTPSAIFIATAPPLDPSGTDVGAGPTVFFGPEGTRFDVNDKTGRATVTVPYDAAFDADTSSLVISTRDAKGKITVVPPPYTFDTVNHLVSFATSHFSSFRATSPVPGTPGGLLTIASIAGARDVCIAFDDSGSPTPLAYFVAGGSTRTVQALRLSLSGQSIYTTETYAGGGASSADGTQRLSYQFPGDIVSVFGLQDGTCFAATRTQIFRIAKTGEVTRVAGTGVSQFGGNGGPATSASFVQIRTILVDLQESIFVADEGDHRVRLIDAIQNNTTSTWAGTGVAAVSPDGTTLAQSSFVGPFDLEFDGTGGLFVADGPRLRQMKPDPINAANDVNVTVAGDVSGAQGSTGDGGPALSARFQEIQSVVRYLDPLAPNDTQLVVADRTDHTVRLVNLSADRVTLVIGQHGTLGNAPDTGPATGLLNGPLAVAMLPSQVIVVDGNNGKIRALFGFGL